MVSLSKDELESQDNAVWMTTIWVSMFLSLLLNFIYAQFLQDMCTRAVGSLVLLSDKVGVDIHILRHLQLVIFDSRSSSSPDLNINCALISFVVVPLFIIGLRFWTAPVYTLYALKMNSVLAPLSMVAIFGATHIDVVLMGVLVFLMNAFVFWYHVDPPVHKINGGKYQRHRP